MLERIIEGCEVLFRKFGIKSLSMDDIARELGMSKRTIYQYVTDKNDLVKKTFSHLLLKHRERCVEISGEKINPVDEIKKFSLEMSNQMKGTNPAIFFDLRKYHPEAWQIFNNFSEEFIFNQLKQNIQEGQKQGLYREDLDANIVAQLYICLIQTVTNPECFTNIEYEFNAVYGEMIRYHIHGICTPKGIKYFNKLD